MLRYLRIVNYALIDEVEIDFMQGLTAITGETGAGKSILMDAFDLVLGKRADSQVLLDPEKKCVVEAIFDISHFAISSFFEESGLDYDQTAILRREIFPGGKSRAFINDTPVGLTQIKLLGEMLVDIHSQHATTSLQDPGFQLSVIDHFAGLGIDLAHYHEVFQAHQASEKELASLIEKEKTGRSSMDYKKFQLEELNSANLAEGEKEQLEEQLTLLTHAGEIKDNLSGITELFNRDDLGINALLTETETMLKKVSVYHADIENLTQRLASDIIDLKDIFNEISGLNDRIEHNPGQLALVQQKLDLIYRLEHKHQVNGIVELIGIRDRLRDEIDQYSSLEDKILEAENEMHGLRAALQLQADGLSEKRRSSFSAFEQAVKELLQQMGMPDCRFEVRQEMLPEPAISGQDKLEFYFNANLGHAPKPLTSIASGGELSRVMLSIKSILSERKMLPTLVFDEIDNGLSGDIAGKVGEVLVKSSHRMQVIVITHLPQIAGKANHQFAVFKQHQNDKTYSRIRPLNQQERASELAKMIGGYEISEATLQTAKEMLATIDNQDKPE